MSSTPAHPHTHRGIAIVRARDRLLAAGHDKHAHDLYDGERISYRDMVRGCPECLLATLAATEEPALAEPVPGETP